jgi:hypothetical protein
MRERKIGDPEVRTILATRSCPDLQSTVYIRFARVPHMAASVTMVRTYTSPVLHIELPLTSGHLIRTSSIALTNYIDL